MEEKSSVDDEIQFICDEEMMNGIEKIMHDVQHVMHQLEKRFDIADVRKTEKRRRRARRDKETRTKLKKKKRIVQERHEAQVAEQVECASFSLDEDALVYQPRSQGFSVRARRDTRKPWSWRSRDDKKWRYLTSTRQGTARYSLMKYTSLRNK
jgi:hypothetical protein